jgi:WD40 repeat protein
MIAICTIYSDLFLVHEKTGEILFTIENAGWECHISSDGRWVMCFFLEESCLNIIDTIDGQVVRTIRVSDTGKMPLRRGCFSDDGQKLICVGPRFVEMVDMWTDTVFWHTTVDAWYTVSLITSRGSKFIAVEDWDRVYVLNAFDGLIQTKLLKNRCFRGISFANNGLELVMIFMDHIEVLCTDTWTRIRLLPVVQRYSEAFDISPCSKTFVVMNEYNKVSLVDLTTGTVVSLQDPVCGLCTTRCTCPIGSVVNCISFTPDGTGIVTGHRNGHYKLWDTHTGAMLADRDIGCTVACVQCSVDTACDELMLAFAMGNHERLGAESVVASLSTNDVDLVLEYVTGRKLFK